MADTGFNPDEYLNSGSDFDPDLYLSETVNPPLAPEQIRSHLSKSAASSYRGENPIYAETIDAVRQVPRQVGLTARYGLEGVMGGTVADIFGLPKPETPTERFTSDVTKAISTGAGITGIGRQAAAAIPRVAPYMEALTARPGLGLLSAAGSGAGESVARDSGASPLEQTFAGIAGGMAVPTATTLTRRVGTGLTDIAATANVARGGQWGLDRLTERAAQRLVNEPGKVIPALRNATEMVPGVKPTVGEAIAEAQPVGGRFGGAVSRMQKSLTGAAGAEDILPGNMVKQEEAIASYVKGIEKSLGPTRKSILSQSNNNGGVDVDPIIHQIDSELVKPSNAASDMVTKSLSSVRDKLVSLQSSPNNPMVDAEAIYTVRKELRNFIKMAAKDSANWDKKLAGKLERDVQLQIDDAINKSIDPSGKSTIWTSSYMQPYAKQTASVRAHEDRLDQMKAINRVVKSRGDRVTQGDIPALPNLLNRWAQITNFAIRKVIGDANDPVARNMAQKMTDPEEFAKLLSLPSGNPERVIAERVAASVRGIVAGGTMFSQHGGSTQ